ncbi:uridine kinase [Paenibacillus turpanensis]|uniref:uridine kinase n=1 Tax=Paenibacillus turpanensis TaxID=2689078 RepID=UPI00140C589E|nr:uridine kinase [Paenibacillus turpanensis]
MLVIGIAGGTGSGKTTVAHTIVNRLGTSNVSFITQDSYYRDNAGLSMEEREKINYDHPDSFDNLLLAEHLRMLRDKRTVQVPVYDFSQHTRTKETVTVESKPVIIIEGILIFADPQLRELMDIKVFVDTDADVRVLRRIVRDIRERGRTLDSVFQQYVTTVKPMHDAFIEPSKRFADLIIPEGGQNEIGISLLTARIERYIAEPSRG